MSKASELDEVSLSNIEELRTDNQKDTSTAKGENGGDTQEEKRERIWLKTIGLVFNLLTHLLIAVTVFECIRYSVSTEFTTLQLHIVLCVLGYQFFMCQGVLVISKSNGWSVFLSLRHRRYFHGVLHFIGLIMAAAGTVIMVIYGNGNFSAHGILGVGALVLRIVSMLVYELRTYVDGLWLKVVHFVMGITTLLLSSASLCLGFFYYFSRDLVTDEIVFILMAFTGIFTILVIIDRLIPAIHRYQLPMI